MDLHGIFTPRFWIGALGVGGLVGLLLAAAHSGEAANLVRAAGLIWFLLFAALAFGAPERRGRRRRLKRRA